MQKGLSDIALSLNPRLTSHLQGSMMFIIDIDTENGGMQMNNDFCVDFGDEPDGPALAHEVTF